jgi:phosphoglycolate phosphatase-like HAD superfamily hydrolase
LKFDITVTREDGPHKPAPEPIWKIAKQWKLARREVLMVGDYKWDVLCAKNAGIPCALLLNGDPLPDWARLAKFHVRRLTEIIGVVVRSYAIHRAAGPQRGAESPHYKPARRHA